MQTDIIRAELERLFELEELEALSRDILGFDPSEVGGTAAKGTFAGALTEHCIAHEAIEALCDALWATRRDLDPRIAELRIRGISFEKLYRNKDIVGPFRIKRLLGEGQLGAVYVGRIDNQDYRIKILNREATRDPRSLQRFFTLNRLVGKITNAALPRDVRAGQFGDAYLVAHRHVEGNTLATRVSRTGPMYFNEARPLLTAILTPLRALHERRIAHGDLHLGNIIAEGVGGPDASVVLLDVACDRLLTRPRAENGKTRLFSTGGSPRTVSPEQIQGQPPDARSDVYSFGAILYELLTGKPVFGGPALQAAFGHLNQRPAPPSKVAPPGWVPQEIDGFVLNLLRKNPNERPQDAEEVLGLIGMLGRSQEVGDDWAIGEEAVTQRIEALIQDPTNAELARELESLVEDGAPPERLAEAFKMAVELLDEGPHLDTTRVDFLFRAARLYESSKHTLDMAAKTYKEILALRPDDEIAIAGLEEARKRTGKFEDLIEMLLERHDRLKDASEQSRIMGEIGEIYATELRDRDQAIFAYTRAVCEDPNIAIFSEKLEELAGKEERRWNEILDTMADAAKDGNLLRQRNGILLRMARWYQTGASRADLALACLQKVTESDPSNDEALAGQVEIYRKTQEWRELGIALTRRAEISTPALARDLRAECAEILEKQLNDVGGARDIYETILREDPSHARAAENLSHILERTDDYESLTQVLEARAKMSRGEQKVRLLCRLGEILDTKLGDLEASMRAYRGALAEDKTHRESLVGLDHVLSKAGRFNELVENLQAQVDLSSTPRQKINLYLRIAGIHEEEFLNHEAAAAALEHVLEIDSGHLAAMEALVRHARVLGRWEQVAELYERMLLLVDTDPRHRTELALAWGRVLADQVGSPDRATAAYETVLQIDPEHAGALEALAKLRESAGDADAALDAILALADKATSNEARAQQFIRAATLCESRGDRDRAIEHYKNALDADPDDRDIAVALRAAYTARGDVNAALQLLEREIERTEGDRARAKLAGEMALLAREHLKDDERATQAAKRALEYDPTNLDGLRVLGDIAFEKERFLEASKHYQSLADHADAMPKDLAARLLVRYVDSLSKSGSTEKALAPMDTLLRIAPDDLQAIERVAYVTFEHGAPKRAVELYHDLLDRFSEQMGDTTKANCLYRYGESLRRAGETQAALGPLEEAAELDPETVEPLVSLAQAHAELEDWEEVIRAKRRHHDLVLGDNRVELLLEMGDITAEKLGDHDAASKLYVAALEIRANRRVLTKLMQLYSEEKDWEKLVEIVVKLAEFAEDDSQKAKYLQTAALACAEEIGDIQRALDFYKEVLELDPSVRALEEATELYQQRGEYSEVERLLKQKLELVTQTQDHEGMLRTFTELAVLYEKDLGDVENAIDAYEAAHTLDPGNKDRAAVLGELYSTDPKRYLDKGVAAFAQQLRDSPFRQDAYRALRRLYTETKHTDGSYCLCQAMSVLNLAEPDEERYYQRLRPDGAAAAQEALSDEDWLSLVLHEAADPLLTSVLALIEPAVIDVHAIDLEEYGYDDEHLLDLENHYSSLGQNLFFAAGVMGMAPPPTYENVDDEGGLSFLHSYEPSVVLGNAALSAEIPPQAAAFIAARHLTFLRPGLYLRQLIGTGTGLKSWLFAAIKLTAPTFPVAKELEGPVQEALDALKEGLKRDTRDHLTRVVSKMLKSGAALDLHRWIAGVDLTADRVGLIVAQDLATATEIVRASEDSAAAVPVETRFKELVLYSVSAQYLQLRRKLGVQVE